MQEARFKGDEHYPADSFGGWSRVPGGFREQRVEVLLRDTIWGTMFLDGKGNHNPYNLLRQREVAQKSVDFQRG